MSDLRTNNGITQAIWDKLNIQDKGSVDHVYFEILDKHESDIGDINHAVSLRINDEGVKILKDGSYVPHIKWLRYVLNRLSDASGFYVQYNDEYKTQHSLPFEVSMTYSWEDDKMNVNRIIDEPVQRPLSESEFKSYTFLSETLTRINQEIQQETQSENWGQVTANMVETLPTVSSTVKGRLPEYLKFLFILSSMTYRTEDKSTLYRVAICNKSPNVSTAYDSFYLVLDEKITIEALQIVN
jgi:hypothetical protein